MKRRIGRISAMPRVAVINEMQKKDWAFRFSFDGGQDIPEDEGGGKSVRVSG